MGTIQISDPRENVAPDFIEAKLRKAQQKSWQILYRVGNLIQPGMTESQAKEKLKEIQSEFGAEKSWHPPQIRFGPNTKKSFGEASDPTIKLGCNDLFYLDIGPVIEGYEGDVGETFMVGSDPEIERLIADSKSIFQLVKHRWKETGCTGQKLYCIAEQIAANRGWCLSLTGASGHRISEFPHALHHRGKLRAFDGSPLPERWVLEIHLLHPTRQIAAFFEDIL